MALICCKGALTLTLMRVGKPLPPVGGNLDASHFQRKQVECHAFRLYQNRRDIHESHAVTL
jgi:hypothetical protein